MNLWKPLPVAFVVALVVTLVFGGSVPLAIVMGFAVTGLTLAVLMVSPWGQRPRTDTER